jgi:hypothetical protein
MRDAVALTALVAVGSLLACSSAPDASDAGRDASEDHDQRKADAESHGDAPTRDAAPPPLGGVRVADWSAAAAPVDFCLAPHGTANWQGPMIGAAGPQDAGAYADGGTPGLTFGDGGASGLGFPGVTSYFYVAPAHYDARLVAAGSPDCNVPVVAPDATTLPVLSEGGLITIALFTDVGRDAGAAGLKIVGFTDDVSVPPPSLIGKGRCGVRFINAAPSVPSVDFGTGPPSFFVGYLPMFSSVLYGQASTALETTAIAPFVDDNGYLFTSALLYVTPPMGTSFGPNSFSASVLVDQTPVTLAIGATIIAADSVVTVVLIPEGIGSIDDAGIDAGGLGLLQCIDNAGTLGLGAACTLISQ